MKTDPPGGGRRGGGWIAMATGFARLVLASRHQRRQILFFLMSAVLGQIFLGVFVLERWLTAPDRVLVFLGYWGLCLAATGFAFLLALYDLLEVRRAFRSEVRRQTRETAVELAREIRAADARHDGEEDEGGDAGPPAVDAADDDDPAAGPGR